MHINKVLNLSSHEMALVEYTEQDTQRFRMSDIKPQWRNPRNIPNRYPHGICSVLAANYIDLQPRSKIEFDRLNAPEQVGEWKYDPIATHDRQGDGIWESRLRTKRLFCNDIQIIVRWFDLRLARGSAQ